MVKRPPDTIEFSVHGLSPWVYFIKLSSMVIFFFSSTTLLLPTHLPPPSCTHAQSCNPMDCSPPGSSVHGSSVLLPLSRQEYWSGLPFPFPHVVIYHVQSFSDGHFSPQVSYSMILFIPWNYEGKKKKKESTRENQRPFKYFHHESTSCRGNISQKCSLLNFHKSFPFKMSHWSDSEIKLEALSVHVSSCSFFISKLLE